MCMLGGACKKTKNKLRFVRERASWLSHIQGSHSSGLITLFSFEPLCILPCRGHDLQSGHKRCECSGEWHRWKGSRKKQRAPGVVHSLANQYQLALPIPLTTINKTQGVRYTGTFTVLSLCDWCRFHVDFNTWHILAGLSRPDEKREQAIFSEFWRRYRLLKPTHQMWKLVDEHSIDLGRTAPLILHGDEGRGRKRAAFLVLAYHSYLG